MRIFIFLVGIGFLAGCATSNADLTEDQLVKAYISETNPRFPRRVEVVSFEKVVQEGKNLVTHVAIGLPGTPTREYRITDKNFSEQFERERNWVCKHSSFNSLVEAGYSFRIQITNHKASYKPENHELVKLFEITSDVCRSG